MEKKFMYFDSVKDEHRNNKIKNPHVFKNVRLVYSI